MRFVTKLKISQILTQEGVIMKCIKQGLLIATLSFSFASMSCTEDGKEGFLPENSLKISVHQKRDGGLSEEQFNQVIDKVESLYTSIVEQEGGDLKIDRNWEDGTVNAYAQRSGKQWNVAMFGGLARHETITEDGFALVVCHELGHHIGGAPKKFSFSSWASNEGQADYFSTLKCLRRVFLNDDNASIIKLMTIPEEVSKQCASSWKSEADQALCIRGAMAGDSVSKLFASLRSSTPGSFSTPDAGVVTRTNDNHPAYQCRLDTYFQGALCEINFNEDVAQNSEVTGTCHGSLGHTNGLRPRCWFKPSVQ
jgi:hypothetical protein